MSHNIEITPVAGPITANIRPPGSKSITNRALICAALAGGTSHLQGALDSEDTQVMIAALRNLGIAITASCENTTLEVVGCHGKIPVDCADLYVANSGTTMRFLTAMLTLAHGQFRLDGIERMRQRPIADLIDALAQLGAHIRTERNNGCPPLVIDAQGLAGGTATISGKISSQYLSGLLMACPLAQRAIEVDVSEVLVSVPYVEMTLHVMKSFGVSAEHKNYQSFLVKPNQTYSACTYEIEPDASAASYFFALAAIVGGTVTVEGLSRESLQGDVAFGDCLQQMGCAVKYDRNSISVTANGGLQGITVDMNGISDTVQTLAAVALFAEGTTTIRNVAHIRHKETDRIGDLATELRKLGATVEELEDGLRITPGQLQPAEIETYNDHRMAMSLALVGLRQPGVVILDPECTQKTYPGYFGDLEKITG